MNSNRGKERENYKMKHIKSKQDNREYYIPKLVKPKQKRGAISLEVIFIIIITLTSIALLLALFSKNLSGFSRAVYCKTVFYVHSSDFIPVEYRQDPQYCKYSLFMNMKVISPQTEYISAFLPDKKREIINNFTEKNLSFTFDIPAYKIEDLNFKIKQDKIRNLDLKFCNKSHKIRIKDKLSYIKLDRREFSKCNKTLNNFVLNISGSSEYAKLSNLRITYSKCYPNEEILSHILACWERVNYGNYAKNKICEQFILSKDCQEVSTSEEDITKLLVKNDVCNILGNNDTLNCGEENNLDYRPKKIEHNQNYIIEFDSKNKRIVVS